MKNNLSIEIYGTVYSKKGKNYLALENKEVFQKRLSELMGKRIKITLIEEKENLSQGLTDGQ